MALRVVLTVLAFVAGAHAQTSGGAISGTVRDATGGVIPGALVSVFSLAAPSVPARSVVTNARGTFVFGSLPAGQYELTVTLSGFRTSRSRLELAADQQTTADVRLEIGALSEAIVVRGMRPPSPGAAVPAVAPPASVAKTVAEYLYAAKIYREQGRLTEAEAMTRRALELMRVDAPTVTTAMPSPVDPNAPVRVGGSIREPRKVRDVKPIYPAEALAAGVEGIVILEAIIAKDGSVQGAKVLRTIPVLEQAALEAVSQWQFTPTLLNGVPVEVVMTVTVTFTTR